MYSQKFITRQYSNVIYTHKDMVVEPNRVNCYVCESCKQITKTIDIAVGVTSFIIPCPVCGCAARSSFYSDLLPDYEPTMEWYRPTIAQALKKKKDHSLMDHLLQGGLSLRTIVKEEKSNE